MACNACTCRKTLRTNCRPLTVLVGLRLAQLLIFSKLGEWIQAWFHDLNLTNVFLLPTSNTMWFCKCLWNRVYFGHHNQTKAHILTRKYLWVLGDPSKMHSDCTLYNGQSIHKLVLIANCYQGLRSYFFSNQSRCHSRERCSLLLQSWPETRSIVLSTFVDWVSSFITFMGHFRIGHAHAQEYVCTLVPLSNFSLSQANSDGIQTTCSPPICTS